MKKYYPELEVDTAILRKQNENHIDLLCGRESEIVGLEHKITDLEQKVGALSARLSELYKINTDLSEQLNFIFNSRSWKITKPFRVMARYIRGF